MNVIIIGAGMTGIGAAYYLRAAGISYTILERNRISAACGTRTPGTARVRLRPSSTPSALSPTFRRSACRSRARSRNICARWPRFCIAQNIVFDCRVLKAVFDSRSGALDSAYEPRQLQRAIPDQRQRVLLRRAVCAGVSGCGQVQGRDRSPRISTASARSSTRTWSWSSSSTAICCAPELARVAKSLVLVQRSPASTRPTIAPGH